MASNGTSPVPQTRPQPTIRSFFQPRCPNYAPPPSAATRQPQPSIPQPLPAQEAPSQSSNLTSPPPPTTTPHLPPQASISPIAAQHIQPLRRLNSLLLPIPYPDAFYNAILTSTPPFSRIITWGPEQKVIGGVVCRLDALPSGAYDIYIQSLALLSPYRGKGLAGALLEEIVMEAVKYGIESLYAHVWTENEEGLEWYSKRGFEKENNILAGYYRKLKPDSAYIFRRKIQPSDHLHCQPPAQFVKTESTPLPAENVRPGLPNSARSFQDKGPEREWNDLPEDVLGSGLLRPGSHLSTPGQGSAASSRSSSRSGTVGKKKRVYPAAAFGS